MKAKLNTASVALLCNVCLLLFVAARAHITSQSFDKITVREFELVDDNGQNRVSIKVEPDGELVFRMKDEAGTIRVKLGAGEEGSGFVLLNDKTQPAIHALAKKDKTTLTLTNPDGTKREF